MVGSDNEKICLLVFSFNYVISWIIFLKANCLGFVLQYKQLSSNLDTNPTFLCLCPGLMKQFVKSTASNIST